MHKLSALILFLAFFSITRSEAGPKMPPVEGFENARFYVQAVGANASAAVSLSGGEFSQFSIWLDQSASFTFRYTSGTATPPAAINFYRFTGSTTLELVPQHVSTGGYILIQNGATAQTVRLLTLGD